VASIIERVDLGCARNLMRVCVGLTAPKIVLDQMSDWNTKYLSVYFYYSKNNLTVIHSVVKFGSVSKIMRLYAENARIQLLRRLKGGGQIGKT
jgi:hypothetical protein